MEPFFNINTIIKIIKKACSDQCPCRLEIDYNPYGSEFFRLERTINVFINCKATGILPLTHLDLDGSIGIYLCKGSTAGRTIPSLLISIHFFPRFFFNALSFFKLTSLFKHVLKILLAAASVFSRGKGYIGSECRSVISQSKILN
jgi:hypothetical protein